MNNEILKEFTCPKTQTLPIIYRFVYGKLKNDAHINIYIQMYVDWRGIV